MPKIELGLHKRDLHLSFDSGRPVATGRQFAFNSGKYVAFFFTEEGLHIFSAQNLKGRIAAGTIILPFLIIGAILLDVVTPPIIDLTEFYVIIFIGLALTVVATILINRSGKNIAGIDFETLLQNTTTGVLHYFYQWREVTSVVISDRLVEAYAGKGMKSWRVLSTYDHSQLPDLTSFLSEKAESRFKDKTKKA